MRTIESITRKAARLCAPALLFLVALFASCSSAAGGAVMRTTALSPSFSQVGSIQIPGKINGLWCYDVGVVSADGHYYLSDSSLKQIDVVSINRSGGRDTIDRPIGTGDFTGVAGCHKYDYSGQGPNGLLRVGGTLFAGNGNSHVLAFDTSGRQLADIDTRGNRRADEMAVGGGPGRHQS